MAYGVVKKHAVQALNDDSLNRSAKYAAAAVEDGMIFQLNTLSSTRNENEVWVATAPATSYLNKLWMAQDFGVNTTVSGSYSYKGLNDDPRVHITPAGDVFSVFKPKEKDVLLMTADAFSGAKTTETFANAANATLQLVWGSTQTASALSFRLVATTYLSIGQGSSVSNRVTAYRMECIAE